MNRICLRPEGLALEFFAVGKEYEIPEKATEGGYAISCPEYTTIWHPFGKMDR